MLSPNDNCLVCHPCRLTAVLLMALTAARASSNIMVRSMLPQTRVRPTSTSIAAGISSLLGSTAQWLQRFEAESSTVQSPLLKRFRCAEARAFSRARQNSCCLMRDHSLILRIRSTCSRSQCAQSTPVASQTGARLVDELVPLVLPRRNASRQEAFDVLRLSDQFVPDRHFQITAV